MCIRNLRKSSPDSWIFLGAFLLFIEPSLAQIVVEPPALDFGDRGQNDQVQAEITLKNTGGDPVWIRQIKKGCDCIRLSPSQIQDAIPGGGSVQIQVTMGSGRAMGRLDKWITILLRDLRKPQIRVPVSMRVLDGFEMDPREVRFEGVVGGQPEQKAVEVKTRRGRTPVPIQLEIKEIRSRFNRSSDRHLQAKVVSVPGGKQIVIQLSPTHPEGIIAAELEARLNGKALFVPIGGVMFAWIKVSPNYINFSRALEGKPDTTTREVILSSTDGRPFKILDIKAQAYRRGEKTVRLEFTTIPVGGPSSALETEASSLIHKITCRVFRGEITNAQATFFGTVTVRTDHPQKPEISLKYSGFFASPKK